MVPSSSTLEISEDNVSAAATTTTTTDDELGLAQYNGMPPEGLTIGLPVLSVIVIAVVLALTVIIIVIARHKR